MAHYHPYHLVEPSPYPYMASFGALGLTIGSVMYFQSFAYGNLLALFSFILITIVASMWWRDIVREATYQGHHTLVVQRGLKYFWRLPCRLFQKKSKKAFSSSIYDQQY